MSATGRIFLTASVIGISLTSACSCTTGSGRGFNFCIGDRVEGNGQPAERRVELPAFQAIEAGGALQLFLHVGERRPVVIHGDSNLVEHVRARVEDQCLVLDMKPGGSYSPQLPLKVDIWLPEPAEARLSGAAELTARDLRLSSFTLEMSGAANSNLSGRIGRLEAQLSGASELDARNCRVDHADLDLSGASEGEIEVVESLDATCSGASDLDYWGRPAHLNMKTSGASDITAHDPVE